VISLGAAALFLGFTFLALFVGCVILMAYHMGARKQS
jgi:hypothetical protein